MFIIGSLSLTVFSLTSPFLFLSRCDSAVVNENLKTFREIAESADDVDFPTGVARL